MTTSWRARPLLYNNIDGLGELGLSFMLLAFAALGWLQLYTSRESVWNHSSAGMLCFALVLVIVHYGSKAFKTRVTYPRTGFVEYAKDRRASIASAVTAALIVVAIGLGSRWHWHLSATATIFGLILSAVYGYRLGGTAWWKWIVAGLMAASSVAVSSLPADHATVRHFPAGLGSDFLLLFTLLGTLLAISGGITLWQYLRGARVPEPETA